MSLFVRMCYCKNKLFEDFFDDVDSDEMIDSEVEETKTCEYI